MTSKVLGLAFVVVFACGVALADSPGPAPLDNVQQMASSPADATQVAGERPTGLGEATESRRPITLPVMPAPVWTIFHQDPPVGDDPIGGCTVTEMITTCTGGPPTCAECNQWYQCPSGGTWVVKPGYCPGTSGSCVFNDFCGG